MATKHDTLSCDVLIEQEIVGMARALPAVSGAGSFILVLDAADNTVKASVNGGAFFGVFGAAAPVTLDGAYDAGGPGLGRAILATDGAVTITNNDADNNNCLELTKNPGGAQSGACLSCLVGANVTSAGFAASFDFRGTAGTVAGNAIVNVEVGAATVLTGRLQGIEIDLDTNVTGGANEITGIRIMTAATTAAAASGQGALCVTSKATLARVSSWRIRNTTAAAGGIHFTEWDAATVWAGQVRCYVIDAQTNVTPGANAFIAFEILAPATTRANTAGEGIIHIDSNATNMRVIDCDVANVGGRIWALRYGAAAAWTSTITALEIDLTTNVTPGAITCVGVNMLIPASTGDCRGILITSTQQLGTIFEAAITPGAGSAIGGILITGNANWTGIGITITQDASQRATVGVSKFNGCTFFYNAGAPNNANGANGDYYFRTDAAAANAALFVKIGGAWAAV